MMDTWADLLRRASTGPINLDISDYGDEWCAGFLAGQENILEEIQAGRVVLPDDKAKDVNGKPTSYTEDELSGMIAALESTGRFDVVGRRW